MTDQWQTADAAAADLRYDFRPVRSLAGQTGYR